ncbi:MAG: GNAT family N-acetyltransferase [Bdellovibrionales bacterium]|nr:GNAT family N-acetyltransferase [Bdellovibrionales bacterium]
MESESFESSYGSFQETLTVGGETFRADPIAPHRAERAAVRSIIAVDGLPSVFEEALLRAAQVCDVPHTWCVKECKSEDEVTPEILATAKTVLHNDKKDYNARIITYLGIPLDASKDELLFLAAGAIRNKLTKEYENDEFPVVSRAVVAPAYRGKGLGSLIVEHRMLSALRYFTKPPKAIHFATESAPIFTAVKHAEKLLGSPFVHIGTEQYQTRVGLLQVMDFLCFLPQYRASLLAACRTLDNFNTLKQPHLEVLFEQFMSRGVGSVSGKELEVALSQVSKIVGDSGTASSLLADALSALYEVLTVREIIGAKDIS